MGGQSTAERGLTGEGAQAPALPVERLIATAPTLADVLVEGVSPAEVAARLDRDHLARLVPQLGDAEVHEVARFLADPRVQRMLESAWRTPPRGEPLLAGKLLVQLTQRVDLVRMIQSSPELANSLFARPLTLHHLASHQEAIDVVGSVLDDIADRGAEVVAAEPVPGPEPTVLRTWQREVSAAVRVPEEEAVQPGFDPLRKDDPIYRSAYLDELYAAAEVAQRELTELARRLANEGQPGGGMPGWRLTPKDRVRAEDKITGYNGFADRLKDLAGGKIEFRNLDDLYGVLERLRRDPTVHIVKFSDRFRKPQRSGYRDIQLMLRTSNGHIGEFRLHLAALDEVAVWEHALFEVRRDIEAVAEQEGRALTPTERAIRDAVVREEQRRFWQALQSTMPEVG